MPSFPLLEAPAGIRVNGPFDPSCVIEIDDGDATLAQLERRAKISIVRLGQEESLANITVRLPASLRGVLDISFAMSNASVSFGADCRGRWIARLWSDAHLTVGGGSTANGAFVICNKSTVELGEDCMLSSDVVIQSADQHGIVDLRSGTILNDRPRHTVIGPHVWLGRRAILMPDIAIGEGAIIAAGAVVTRPVPAFSVAAGVPARVIREDVTWSREPAELERRVRRYIADFNGVELVEEEDAEAEPGAEPGNGAATPGRVVGGEGLEPPASSV